MTLSDLGDFGQFLAAMLIIVAAIFTAAWWVVTSILSVQKETALWRKEAKGNLAAVDQKLEWGFVAVNRRLDEQTDHLATLNGQVAKNTERSIRNEERHNMHDGGQ